MDMLKRFCLVALGLLPASLMQADDTDIYFKTGDTNGGSPLVMLTLDYRDNLTSTICSSQNAACSDKLGADVYDLLRIADPIAPVTVFDAMRAVFEIVFEPLEGVQIGMMLNHADDCNGSDHGSGPLETNCSNGAYVFYDFKEFVTDESNTHKEDLLAKMWEIPTPANGTGHPLQGKELYFELYRYLKGGEIYNGHLGYTSFENGNSKTPLFNLDEVNDPNDPNEPDNRAIAWDTDAEESDTKYRNPLTDVNSCSKLAAINLLFQVSSQESASDDAIRADLDVFGNGQITFPDMIKALNEEDFSPSGDADQELTSYFLSTKVNTKTNGYAEAGGTGSALGWGGTAEGLKELRDALAKSFTEILSVSSTFVSAAVPVNVFNRAQINNNIFVAVFKVDEAGKPRWSGNLKKLKIVETITDGNITLSIQDANGNPAIHTLDGRINFDALTFWTDTGKLDPPPATPIGDEVDMVANADGRFVERGGAGQQIPGFKQDNGNPDTVNLTNALGDRKLYTEKDGGGRLDLDGNNATASSPFMITDLGAADVDEAEKILVWARGNGLDGNARSWLLPDILHSKPVPINYGARGPFTEGNPDIRLLMGTNDGFMHMFQNTLSGGAQSGTENWAFIPRASLNVLKILKENTAAPGIPPHPYGVDGPATIYIDDQNSDNTISGSDRVWAFFGMRRGGNNIYALDISNPDDPSVMWTIEDDTSGFGSLALTFSQPTLINIQYGGSSRPALIFGGGYNGGWDAGYTTRIGKDAGAGTDSDGNAIFIVDAETGALIWRAQGGSSTGRSSSTLFTHADMDHSIPSRVAVLDSNGDGLDDRGYVGDTGGGVWRIDFPSSTGDNRSTEWQAIRMAQFSGDDHRFFHKPDVIQANRDGTSFDAVVLGSGDRADPLKVSVDNALFMIKDSYTSAIPALGVSPISESDLPDITNTCLSEDSACTVDLSQGWRLQLESNGEKALSSPVTIFGSVFFTTYTPQGSSISTCEPKEGTGRIYAVSLFNGSAAINRRIDDGGNEKPSTKDDRFDTLDSGGIPSDPVVPIPDFILRPDLKFEDTGASKYWKTFWYERNID